jgi:Ca2+-binding RTX toxin-like protein
MAAYVNLSTAPYTISPIQSNGATKLSANTAIGGNGNLTCGPPPSTVCTPVNGIVTVTGISNVIDTPSSNDVVVLGSGSGRVIGGNTAQANDTFVPTGGSDVINGGTGVNNTIDLSLLPGATALNLWSSSPQALGNAQAGRLTLVPGTIETAIASPGGSTLEAGNGNNIALDGGPGTDILVAGTGNQTLNACGPSGTSSCGGNDVLVAGIGTDHLNGGTQGVTFMPGSGGTDVIQSAATTNTLSYSNLPVSTPWKRPPLLGSIGALVNISGQTAHVPVGEPFAGTAVPANSASGAWGAAVQFVAQQPLPVGTNIIDSVVGSTAPDILVTGTGNTVSGGGGNDLFYVNGGGNTLTAANGSASTFLFMAAGNNTINGGGSATVDFSQGSITLQVTLPAPPPSGSLPVPGTASGGFPGSQQTLFGVLNVTGSQGNNVLNAATSGGNTLIGGSGDNTFCAQASCAGGVPIAAGNTLIGGSGNNLFCAQNGGADTIDASADPFGSTAFVDPVDNVGNPPPQNVFKTPGAC